MIYNLLNFPTSTIVAKNVPKNAFYKRAKPQRSSALRTFLTDDFESILWLYKLHPSTLNIADGQQVHEIDVFYGKMKTMRIDVKLLCEMDMLLPRHTLYIIEYDEKTDLMILPKTVNAQGKITQRGIMEVWEDVDLTTTPLAIVGHDMDRLYGYFLGKLSQLNTLTEDEYTQAAELRQQQELLTRQYATLDKKIRSEKQFNLKFSMNSDLRKLRQQIEAIELQMAQRGK